jgi:hypothetical protein
MLEFFKDLIIVTAGVWCLVFWFLVIVAGLVELIDTVTGKHNGPTVEELGDVDLRFEGEDPR